jgi:hypothetical protein
MASAKSEVVRSQQDLSTPDLGISCVAFNDLISHRKELSAVYLGHCYWG